MLVRRLVLKNYSAHADLELNFTPGINGIVGPNGSGKSTILDAIRFAVTGSSILDGSLKDNVAWGEKTARVWLEFSHGDSVYTIERRLGKSTTQCLTTPEGEFTKQSEIQTQLEGLFETTFESMLNNVFVQQGRIEAILFATNTQRLREIQRVVGLDNLAMAEKALGLEINSVPLTVGLAAQISEVSTMAATARIDLLAGTEQLQLLNSRMEVLRPAVAQLEEFLAVERSREALLKVEADIEVRVSRVSELSGECARLKDDYESMIKLLANYSPEAESSKEKLAAFEASQRQQSLLTSIRSKLTAAEYVLQRIPRPLPDLEAVKLELDKATAVLEVRRPQLQGLIPRPKVERESILEARIHELDSELKALKQPEQASQEEVSCKLEMSKLKSDLDVFATGVCPTCNQAVHDFDPAAVTQEIANLQARFTTAEKERRLTRETLLRGLSAERAEHVTELTEVQALINGVLKDSVTKLITQVASLTQTHATAQAVVSQEAQAARDIAGYRAQLSELGVVADVNLAEAEKCRKILAVIESAQGKQRSAETQLQIKRDQLEHVEVALAQSRELRAGFGALRSIPAEELDAVKLQAVEFNQLRAQEQHLMSTVGVGQARVQSLTESVERLNAQYVHEGHSRKWIDLCRRVRDIVHVSGLPTLMMKEYAVVLNRRMQYYLDVWEAPFVMKLDDGLAFVAEFRDGLTHGASRLSGGQQIVASTSFRLAMVETFARDLGFLVLDEPSNYLDKDNIYHLQQLLLRLRELASANSRQILLVTHEASLEGFFDNTINLYR